MVSVCLSRREVIGPRTRLFSARTNCKSACKSDSAATRGSFEERRSIAARLEARYCECERCKGNSHMRQSTCASAPKHLSS